MFSFHTDRNKRANRNFQIIKFGERILTEGWQKIKEDMSHPDQAVVLEKSCKINLIYCVRKRT